MGYQEQINMLFAGRKVRIGKPVPDRGLEYGPTKSTANNVFIFLLYSIALKSTLVLSFNLNRFFFKSDGRTRAFHIPGTKIDPVRRICHVNPCLFDLILNVYI